jgi:hypothetical protein
MWHRRRAEKATLERTGTSDPLSTVIWQEGHLPGGASTPPVIKAPRASDLAAANTA